MAKKSWTDKRKIKAVQRKKGKGIPKEGMREEFKLADRFRNLKILVLKLVQEKVKRTLVCV